jgi:hypothetical protein
VRLSVASLRLPLARHPLSVGDFGRCHLGGRFVARFCRALLLRGRKPQPHSREHVVLRHAEAVDVHDAEIELSRSVAMVSGLLKPFLSFGVVFWNASPARVQDAEIELGVRILVGSRLQVPSSGLDLVLRHAVAIGVHHAKVVLGGGVSLLG